MTAFMPAVSAATEKSVDVTVNGSVRGYDTIDEAWGAAVGTADGVTVYITLNEDVCPTDVLIVPANKTIVLDLNSFDIDRKLLSALNGGNVITNEGDLQLRDSSESGDGRITGGYNLSYGGGVINTEIGKFTIISGSVAGNISEQGGGGVYNMGSGVGCFTVQGGSVSGNWGGAGGGVYNEGEFNLKGGRVSGNWADNGGGVYNYNTFIMSGGFITNNLSGIGGGISLMDSEDSSLTISGGSVTDNRAIIEPSGGICAEKSISISGAFEIKNNFHGGEVVSFSHMKDHYVYTYAGGTPADLFLHDGLFVTVTGELTGSAIGVITAAVEGKIPIASGNAATLDDFVPNIPEYLLVEENNTIYLVPSEITISFDSDGGSEVESITQAYGTAVSEPEAPTNEGFIFTGWTLDDEPYTFTVMPAESIELLATWAVSASYTVDWYIMDTNGSYKSERSEKRTGAVDTIADITAEVFPESGFYIDTAESVLSGSIGSDGLLVLEVYLGRSKYNVSFDAGEGYFCGDMSMHELSDNLYYGAEINAETPKWDGHVFKGWDSEPAQYVPVDGAHYTALWGAYHNVTFIGMAGIISEQTVEVGTDAVIPTPGDIVGYRFIGWDINANADEYKGSTQDIKATAKYEINTDNTYNVTANGIAAVYTQYQLATITADAQKNCERFSYWMDGDGNIVSCYRTYSFYVHTDVVLTPVYGEDTAGKAVTRITKFENTENILSIYAERSLSEDYKVFQHGVIITDVNEYFANAELFTLDEGTPKGVHKAIASNTDGCTGLYTLTVDNIDTFNTVIYARSYVKVVRDGIESYIYSSVKTIPNPEGTAPLGDELPGLKSCIELDTEQEPIDDGSKEPTVLEIVIKLIFKIFAIIKKVYNWVVSLVG